MHEETLRRVEEETGWKEVNQYSPVDPLIKEEYFEFLPGDIFIFDLERGETGMAIRLPPRELAEEEIAELISLLSQDTGPMVYI
jgi:hypothetical protein